MKLLFICTHNRCRSILAEAITNHLGMGRVQARSAGSQPAGEVHPLTLKYLSEKGINVKGLKSESWNDFEQWQPDAVITVCDSAAAEQCPLWIGNALKVHWGLIDPSRVEGSELEIGEAFINVIEILESRIQRLLALPDESLSRPKLSETLTKLGDM